MLMRKAIIKKKVAACKKLTPCLARCNGYTITARFGGPYLFRRLVRCNTHYAPITLRTYSSLITDFYSLPKVQFSFRLALSQFLCPVLPSSSQAEIHLQNTPSQHQTEPTSKVTSTSPVSLSFDCFVEPNAPFCSSNAVSREVQKQTFVLQIPSIS